MLLAGAEVRREGDLSEAVEAMVATLKGLADEPPTAEEVDRAKTDFAVDFERAFNDPGALGGNLSRWASRGDWRLMFLHRDRVAEVTSDDVMARIKNAVDRHVNSGYDEGHVFYSPTFDELVARCKAVTVEQARDYWASFHGAEGGTVAIVGDFDPDEIVPVLEEALGGWSAREAYTPVDRPYADVAAVAVDIEMPDKANAAMAVYLRIRMRDDHADHPALVLVNYILNPRLGGRIRQQEGLSYAVGSEFSAHPSDEIATFFGYAISRRKTQTGLWRRSERKSPGR